MNKKSGVSMIVLAVTITVMAILISVTISFLEDTDIINDARNKTKDSNLIQVKDILNTAWNNANASIEPTLEELQAVIDKTVLENNIDTTKYNIIVTEDGVYVSRDFVAPIISSSSMSYTNTTATVNLTFGRLDETDYPITVEYYIKKSTAPVEAYSFKEKVTLIGGTSNSYTFTGLASSTSYNSKIILIDVNGNKSETTLNLTTQ